MSRAEFNEIFSIFALSPNTHHCVLDCFTPSNRVLIQKARNYDGAL